MTAPGRRLRCAFCSFEAAWPGELDHHERVWHHVEREARDHDVDDELGRVGEVPDGPPEPVFEQERLR